MGSLGADLEFCFRKMNPTTTDIEKVIKILDNTIGIDIGYVEDIEATASEIVEAVSTAVRKEVRRETAEEILNDLNECGWDTAWDRVQELRQRYLGGDEEGKGGGKNDKN